MKRLLALVLLVSACGEPNNPTCEEVADAWCDAFESCGIDIFGPEGCRWRMNYDCEQDELDEGRTSRECIDDLREAWSAPWGVCDEFSPPESCR